jgi:BMFP domain-containing protein YqiC
MQSQSRFFDELAKLMTSAAGAAQGAAREVDTLIRAQIERVASEFDLVKRDEFDAMKALAQAAKAESEALRKRVDVLEKALGIYKAPESKKTKPQAARKKKAATLRQA